jgi:hypothetical protein
VDADEHRVWIVDEVKLDVPTLRHDYVNIDRRNLMVWRALMLASMGAPDDGFDFGGTDRTGLKQILDVNLATRFMLEQPSLQRGDHGLLRRAKSLRYRHQASIIRELS